MKQQFISLFFTLLLWFSATSAFSETGKTITLTWKGTAPVQKTSKAEAVIPVFAGAEIKYKERVPVYSLQITDARVSNFQFQNPVYVPFTSEETRFLPKDIFQASPEVSVHSALANGRTLSTISFIPIRKNPQTGQLEKLTRFDYTYSANTAFKEKKGGNLRSNKTASVLSSGDWYRIGITGSGMYKLDYATLQGMGLNLQNIDPRRIQLYGNGGGMLPQANDAPRADDLVENAIYFPGESDGQFNPQDYILFYGQGPHTWKLNNNKDGFNYNLNIYSDTAYYFLTVGAAPGQRVSNAGAVSGTPTATITTFNERAHHEIENRNLLASGRVWYGEEFNSYKLSHEINFGLSDLDQSSPVTLTSAVAGVSPVSQSVVGGRFTLKVNNATIGFQDVMGHGSWDYHPAGDDNVQTFSFNLNTVSYNNSNLRVGLSFNQMGQSSSLGLLNYLEINAKRRLLLFNNQTNFRSLQNIGPNAISQFRIGNISNAAETVVWDITDPLQPVRQQLAFNGSEATFSALTDTVREFVVFSGTGFYAPFTWGRVANQNLHALNKDGKLDMVIVSHPLFLSQAQRLANHRHQRDKLNIAIVTPRQVYNEFSSGAQDVTAIRDLMKMIYDRKILNNTKTGDSLIYLLLFGDASYDYKSNFANSQQNRTQNNTNFVPVYESFESLDQIDTYSSEDYFTLLDDNEGAWPEYSSSSFSDIGVGRLPAASIEDAESMVNKIIAYDSPEKFGKWRNRVTFIADDQDGNLHQNATEAYADSLIKKQPAYNVNKVYLDMFRQVAVANGQRSPDCVAEIDRAVEQGSLIINYSGHGGETGLAHEQIVTVGQINNWNNINSPSFFVTATCEFGRYDDPRRPSAAEFALKSKNGGAIGLITTTRPVGASSNDVLNRSFYNFAFKPVNGQMPRLGDIVMHTKNASISGSSNRNFALLGDPSMRLAYPEEKVQVSAIDIKPSVRQPDTLKALSTVKISGNVANQNGQTLSDFNGKVNITVFEKETVIRTLGDNGSSPQNIKTRESIIYEGVATAKNGLWSSTFVVPKDINYLYGNGKISLYAASGNLDAHGANTDIIIGGSAANIPADTIPPVISLFMDNEAFVYGGLTGTNSLLISHLSDSSGINTAGLGIGHEITATLDGNKENIKVLNEYYISDLDNFRSGKVRYMFKNLTPGPHELRVKAWDTHNNSSEKRIEFIVASSETLALDHVLNYPNPFSTNTTFHFDHNRAGEDLDIQVQIFTVSGKLVRTLSATSFASKPHVAEINWNGRDEYNDVLAKGVYVYKLTVRASRGAKVSKYEKLVILN
ncbi:type IX secretion system sortase PorU [Adhaeribacter terreus]|uniref:Type IX secretion system sortase PorU n=1 Tax=Adhaeribacter terreus TaxID=529703 RepID=A0ABW0E3U3_9BACT